MIQLPIYRFPYHSKKMLFLMESLHTAARRLGTIRANMRRRAGLKIMRVTPYSVEPLLDLLVSLGFKDIEFRMFATKSNDDHNSFVFATSSAVILYT